jgi:glucokinase
MPEGRVVAKWLHPTRPERGGAAVLADVVGLAQSLQQEAGRQELEPAAVGLGVAELVSVDGQVLSEATIHWKGVGVRETLCAATGLPVTVDADVRAAARGRVYWNFRKQPRLDRG